MQFERSAFDEQPFYQGAGGNVGRLVGGEALGQMVEAGATNAQRQRALNWAQTRGFVVAESIITHVVDGVTARVPLYMITAETAVVRATATQPVTMTMVIEEKTWTHRVRAKLGGKSLATGDVGFDRKWHVGTSDVGAAHQLVNESVRDHLREVGCFCTVTYTNGEVEVRLDAERMAGGHVLTGMEIALQLAFARVTTSAYR